MRTEVGKFTAKKACIRCSRSKKRCDRAVPCCELCARVGQKCEYENLNAPYLGLVAKTSLTPQEIAIKGLKEAVIHELDHLSPESVLSAYSNSLEPWFPIANNLRDRLRPFWEEITLDVALLCLSICLVTTSPSSNVRSDGTSQFTHSYLQTKSCLALAEGLGLNSLLIVQSRILLTLFEVSHGLYPAAYISISTTLRAMDALEIHPIEEPFQSQWLSDSVTREEPILTWCGILILDRYIAIESGSQASLTRPRIDWLHNLLKPVLCRTHNPDHDKDSTIACLSRMAEASSVMDRIHSTIYDPTLEHEFNKQELMLALDTSITLKGLLAEEIPSQAHIYSAGIAFCHISHLLVFENNTKLATSMTAISHDELRDNAVFKHILPTISSIFETFATGEWSLDFDYFPPLVTLLLYKVALLTTQRLSLGVDGNEGLARLRILRKCLSIVSERWLSCKRYLELLDENTTPRLLKALN